MRKKKIYSITMEEPLFVFVALFGLLSIILLNMIVFIESPVAKAESYELVEPKCCCVEFEAIELQPAIAMVEETEPENISQNLVDMKKPDPQPLYTPKVYMDMLYQTSAKTYMDYRSITNTSSNQYRLIHSDKIEICEDGFLRDADGYIGVAMGSYFGPIGSRYVCHMDNGKSIPVIKVEAKSDRDAVSGFCGSTSYDIIEFVIDSRAQWMRDNTWGNDYVFSGNFNNYEEFEGTITSIEKI